MPLSQLPDLLSAWLTDITAALGRRSAPRLLLLLVGALFAKGRRTVSSWFRAASITSEFRLAYNALWAAGRQANALAYRLLCFALKPLMRRFAGDHVLFAIDDTPTARYGPKVQGAGIQHNPSPGLAGEKFVYCHIWVTLAWLVRHPAWDNLALPLRALLPAAEAFQESVHAGRAVRDALQAAAAAAAAGAKATADLMPRRGRSSYLGVRALGHPDPGAEAVAVWLDAVSRVQGHLEGRTTSKVDDNRSSP